MYELSGAALQTAVREVEAHAAAAGWDRPPLLFALVPAADLVRREPALAARLGLSIRADGGAIVPIEQELPPGQRPLEEVLAHIEWPDAVTGAAVVLERLMLPADAEAALPADTGVAEAFVAAHPDRVEVRVAAGVLRDGRGHCVVRLRSHDSDDARLEGDEMVPGLMRLLAATLAPESEVRAS